MEGGEGSRRRGRLKIVFTNAQSINNKINELRATVAVIEPDIVALTETWTSELIGDALLEIDGFEMVARDDRKDTENGRGGGILVYAKKELCVWRGETPPDFNQAVTITIKCGSEDVNIHVVYRSPNSKKENDASLTNWVKSMRGNNVMIGNFNFPDIDWVAGTAGSRGREFFEATSEAFFDQHVMEATHNSGNLLDLILCNREEIIKMVTAEGKIGKSDHELISFELWIDEKRDKSQRKSLNYKRANFTEMRTSIKNIDWKAVMQNMDTNESWVFIKNNITELIEKHIPVQKSRVKFEPPWMTKAVKKCIQEKKGAWLKWKKTKKEVDKEEYKRKEKETKKMIRNRKNEAEKNVMKFRKSNPKLFYSHINRARKTRSKIGPLRNNRNEIVVNPKEQATLMNEYFSSVFTRADDEPPTPRDRSTDVNQTLTDIRISTNDVKEAIEKLKDYSAPGLDNIPPKVIKELKEELSVPLTILFQKSMERGKVPDDWREANVTPLFKKGSKADPRNDRPVSLTNLIGKTMERVVKEALTKHIESNNLLSNSQHGFRSGRSTQTNLIEYLNVTTKWLDEGRNFDVLYCDFAKEFDKVCHKRLLVKLKEAGVDGKVLNWLQDWLKGRKQRVRIDDEFSEWIEVLSSVVQGSVLGGILFDIFIDDIDDATLEALVWKFADDTKAAKIIETEDDGKKMQDIVDSLAAWAERWGMAFNVKKCKVLHFGRTNPRFKYFMNGEEVETAKEEKDLGVYIEESLKPARQCAVAAKAANFTLGQIQRAFHYRKKEQIVPLYKTFVRPRLEHAVAAWSPWLESDIKSLEKIQERLIRMLSDVRGQTYEEKLKDAGLTTLKDRRARGDAIQTFKAIKGFNKVDTNKWFELIPESARPTRMTAIVENDGKVVKKEAVLAIERSRLEIRRNFYSVRAAKKWNELPETVKNRTSVNSFKNAYDKWANSEPPTEDDDSGRREMHELVIT